MNHRRLFLKDICKLSVSGGLLFMKPAPDFLDHVLKISEDVIPHEFDAWEDEFQAIYLSQKRELDLTIQEKLKKKTLSSIKKYSWGEGRVGASERIKSHFAKNSYKKSIDIHLKQKQDTDALYDYFSKVPEFMSSPYCNLHLDKNKMNVISGNQCFRIESAYNSSSDLIMFVKNDLEISKNLRDEFIMVHPVFNSIIGNGKYFCYGTPVGMPTVSRCSMCQQFYFTQVFGYKSNDPIYGCKPIYTQLLANPYCNLANDKNPKVHDGVGSVSELVACKCYGDNLSPVIINPGL